MAQQSDAQNPRAFFVVGNEEWGKSSTLKALTGGITQKRYIKITDRWFFIRRMSNDDIPDSWEIFIKGLDPKEKPDVIIALCPAEPALPFLRILQKRGFTLFFWIIRRRCDGKPGDLSDVEIERFKGLGWIEFCHQPADPNRRAAQLKKFIETIHSVSGPKRCDRPYPRYDYTTDANCQGGLLGRPIRCGNSELLW